MDNVFYIQLLSPDDPQKLIGLVSNVVSFLTGFITAVFAEPIRKWLYKAKLKIEFYNDADHLAQMPEQITVEAQTEDGRRIRSIIENKAIYIRVNIQNTSQNTASNCRAYLINIEKETDGQFVQTIYCDSIPLSWSCQEIGKQYEGVEINKGVKQFLDVVTIREGKIDFDPQIKVKPFRYLELFKENGKFRFTIQATASNANPVLYRLIFEWSGDCINFKVYV